MAKQHHQWIVHGTGFVLLSSILSFLANTAWRTFFEKTELVWLAGKPLCFLFLPLALGLDVLKIYFAFEKLMQPHNRTLHNILHCVVEVGKFILIGTAIFSVLGLISLPLLVGPIIFVCGIGLGAVYHAALCMLSLKTFMHSHTQQDWSVCKKNAASLLLSIFITVGAGLLLLSGMGGGALIVVGLITALGTLIGGVSVSLYNYYEEKNASQKLPILSEGSISLSYSQILKKMDVKQDLVKEARVERVTQPAVTVKEEQQQQEDFLLIPAEEKHFSFGM